MQVSTKTKGRLCSSIPRPLACLLASRIALYEANADAVYTRVSDSAATTVDGDDFLQVSPLGYVPALRTDDGHIITEGANILQYIADRLPRALELAPRDRKPSSALSCSSGSISSRATSTKASSARSWRAPYARRR